MNAHVLNELSDMMVVAAAGGTENPVAKVVTVIICFLLVYWILQKYAFGPILGAIDERREQINADLKKAEEERQQAQSERDQLEERLRNIEDEARERMQEAINDGKRIAEEVREQARQQAEGMIEKAKQNIEYETHKAREELKQDVVKLTIQATEHLLHERLDDNKQRELIGDFLNRIQTN